MDDDASDRTYEPHNRAASSRPGRTEPAPAPVSDPAATGPPVGPLGSLLGRERPVLAAGAEPPAEFLPAAQALFGARLALAVAYADRLLTDGVVRGLIGPHEAPRLWPRHLLNCAAVAELIANGSSVTDVGSGAGLPGLVLAVARPDLAIVLIEPQARRATFLTEVVTALGLEHTVSVVRARAEECAGWNSVPPADVVTARALAPLDRLVRWCLPLAAPGGRVLALKGESAAQEIEEHRHIVRELGGSTPVVHRCGMAMLEQPTAVIEVERIGDGPPRLTERPSDRRERRTGRR